MPIVNTTTLVEFEAARRAQNFIPYTNEINTVNESKVNLITYRALPGNYRFDLVIMNKRLLLGDGTFSITGDHNDVTEPYRQMTIEYLATLVVYNTLVITGYSASPGKLIIEGALDLQTNSYLTIDNGAVVTVPVDGTLLIGNNIPLNIQNGGRLEIYGSVYISPDFVGYMLNNDDIYLDPLCTVRINEILSSRMYSLSDYAAEIKTTYQVVGAHGVRSMTNGAAKASFDWLAGSPDTPSHVIDINVDSGEVILGDFHFSLLGKPDNPGAQHRSVGNMNVQSGATLHVSESFMGDNYILPSVYISQLDNLSGVPGELRIYGTVIVDGTAPTINYDKGGTLLVEEGGTLYLVNGAVIHNLDGNGKLVINGTVYIDDIEQLSVPPVDSITFGTNGKLVILNPSPGNSWERKELFSTPNGIVNSELYRLFSGRLEHVQYHVQKNCGIRIDQGYESMRPFSNWYNGVRLEKAIWAGYLIWHDGGYVEIDRSVLPWITMRPGLDQIGYVFKSYYPTAQEKLQDLVNRLKFASSGDMVFRLMDNTLVYETTMQLGCCRIDAVSYNPPTDEYGIIADNDGELFIRSNVPGIKASDLINVVSEQVTVPAVINRTTFNLP